jgi:acyl carrier protein/GNAT superfamily N-acetyltransferase
VSAEAVEQELVRIVREELLLGSERAISVDAPLGELGVGLDSLALVNLLTRIENSMGVELPDDVWTSRGPLSLSDLAELVAATPATSGPPPTAEQAPQDLQGRMERAEYALRGYGAAGRAAWAAIRLVAPAKRFLFARNRQILLERRLDEQAETSFPAPPGVVLRPFEAGDQERLTGLWAPFNERSGRRDLKRWLRRGATALVAAEEGRVVAIDLLAAEGEDEVRVTRSDACYGFYLAEAPAVRGRGVGLALVAYSFAQARELGFRAQLAYVRDDNTAMLAAATQLLGFMPIGTALRTHVLGVSRWSWEIDGRRNSGPALVL